MNKVMGFFTGLNKSTKITLISCGCFVALTVIILGFFVLFPISPSDTVQEKYGREAKASNNTSDTAQVVTTQPADDEYIGSKGTAVSKTVTTTRSTRKKNFSVHVTTGEGFFSGGRIPTGDPYETETTTVPIDEPIEDPTENTSQDVTEDTSQDVTQDPTEDVSQDTTEDVTQDVTQDATDPPTDPPVTEPPTEPPTAPPATEPPVVPPENGDTGDGGAQSW